MRIKLDLLILFALAAYICSVDSAFDSNPQVINVFEHLPSFSVSFMDAAIKRVVNFQTPATKINIENRVINAISNRSAGYFASMCSSRRHSRQFRDSILRPILQERVSGTDGNARVRQHIKSRMLELGWVVDEDQFEADTPVGRRRFTNVVAVLDPRSRSHVTLACHYDSKQFDNDVINSFVGATDAAASCAILIDLATCLNESLHLSRRLNPPSEKSLQLIFFDGEEAIVDWTDEDSLYGSRHLAEVMENELLAPSDGNEVEPGGRRSLLDAMDLMVLLDLVGSKETQFVNWFPQTSHLYSRLSHIERQLWSSSVLKQPAANGYSVGGEDLLGGPVRYFVNDQSSSGSYYRYFGSGIQDDHLPFLARGVPVLHLITYPFPEVWHTEADNETALDHTVISNIATILRVFLADYLDLPGHN